MKNKQSYEDVNISIGSKKVPKIIEIMYSIIQWLFVLFGIIISLAMFYTGDIAIVGGLIVLLSAFVVSPLFNKIPILSNRPIVKTIVKFLTSFILCFIGIMFMPVSDSNKNESPKNDIQEIIETTTATTSVTIIPTTTSTFTTTAPQTTTSTTTTIITSTTTTSTSTSITTSTTTVTTTITTTVPTTALPVVTTIVYTQPPTEPPVPKSIHFVLNTDSNCVHINENCSAAKKILPENWSEIDIPESSLADYNGTYWACGKCSSRYKNELPKFD